MVNDAVKNYINIHSIRKSAQIDIFSEG